MQNDLLESMDLDDQQHPHDSISQQRHCYE